MRFNSYFIYLLIFYLLGLLGFNERLRFFRQNLRNISKLGKLLCILEHDLIFSLRENSYLI